MNADSEKLRQMLDQLHRHLDEADELDADAAAQLQQTLGEIRAVLDKKGPSAGQSEAAASEGESFTDSLETAAVHFEESHPTISGTLRRLIDVLAQMGI